MATRAVDGALPEELLWHRRPFPGQFDHEEDHELRDTSIVEEFRTALHATHGNLLRTDTTNLLQFVNNRLKSKCGLHIPGRTV